MTDDTPATPPKSARPARRTGRPKRADGEGRGAVIGVRVTEIERAEVEVRAARAGLSLSDYGRRAILGHRITAAADAARIDAAALVELNRVGVNLNQIARAVNRNRGQGVPVNLAETLAQVRALIERLAVVDE